MNNYLYSWVNNEKNIILRFIKRTLLKLLEPLFVFQSGLNEEFINKLNEESQHIMDLKQKNDILMSENNFLKTECNSLGNLITNLRVNIRLEDLEKNVRSVNNWIAKTDQSLYHDDPYSLIDYTDFENHFRGSIDLIKDRQIEYLKYFTGCKHVIDIGCGRGEFLSLLQENHINAEGVELYKPYIDYCKKSGLNVHLASGINYLDNLPDDSIDGIYMGQVVEHLTTKELISIIHLAYKKLVPGSYLIMETPNPLTLAIFTHAFYIDPSHNKPIHPYLLQYLAEKSGFLEVSILFLPKSKLPEEFPKIVSLAIDNIEEVNRGIEKLSNLLYGCQDYAVIAQKK